VKEGGHSCPPAHEKRKPGRLATYISLSMGIADRSIRPPAPKFQVVFLGCEGKFSPMKLKYLVCLPIAMLFASCVQDPMTGDVYQQRYVGQAQAVSYGRVTNLRWVQIRGEHGAGTVIGAVTGGLLGSTLGRGYAANTAGAVGGTLVGGVVGGQVEQAAGTRPGIEITVGLNEGGTIAVLQDANPREVFSVGDRVRVVSSGPGARVSH